MYLKRCSKLLFIKKKQYNYVTFTIDCKKLKCWRMPSVREDVYLGDAYTLLFEM